MGIKNLNVVLLFFATLANELFSLDKNKNQKVELQEVILTAFVLAPQFPALLPALKEVYGELGDVANDLDKKDDDFDKVVDLLVSLDFTPDDRQQLNVFVKKTLLALLYVKDAAEAAKGLNFKKSAPLINVAAVKQLSKKLA